MTDIAISERMQKVIDGLRKQQKDVFELGQSIHRLYPPSKIDPDIFQRITVPVPLPMAMMLLGLGCEILVKTAKPAKTEEEAPNAS